MSELEKIGVWLVLWAVGLAVWWVRHRFHVRSRSHHANWQSD